MAVDTYALVTVEYVKAYAGWADGDVSAPALTVYHDESVSATACTVEVTNVSVLLVITGGGNAATYTYTFAASATVGALVTAINAAAKGFVALAVGVDAAASTDMLAAAAVSCFGSDNKQTLQVVSNTTLEYMIDAASDRLERYLDRRIVSRDYVEYHDGAGRPDLPLNQAPVTAVSRVAIGRQDAILVKCTVTDASHAFVRVTPAQDHSHADGVDETAATVSLTITGGANAGTNTLTLSDAANDTIGELATVINALTGWSATRQLTTGAAASHPSAELVPVEGRFVDAVAGFTLEVPDDAESGFALEGNEVAASLYRAAGWPRGRRNTRVDYTAGFATVPDDIQQACAELIKNVYDAAARDQSLRSQKIGNYAYEVSAAPLSKSAEDKLGPWRRHL